MNGIATAFQGDMKITSSIVKLDETCTNEAKRESGAKKLYLTIL